MALPIKSITSVLKDLTHYH